MFLTFEFAKSDVCKLACDAENLPRRSLARHSATMTQPGLGRSVQDREPEHEKGAGYKRPVLNEVRAENKSTETDVSKPFLCLVCLLLHPSPPPNY